MAIGATAKYHKQKKLTKVRTLRASSIARGKIDQGHYFSEQLDAKMSSPGLKNFLL